MRSTSTSIRARPFSAVAACGLPEPEFVVNRCQGRVIEIQPRLTASNRVGLTPPSSAASLPV